MNKKIIIFIIPLIFAWANTSAQINTNFQTPVSINEDGSGPDNTAIFDVQSTTKGMLVPRMASAQRNLIASPATGLLVFDTDTGSFWFFDGGQWANLVVGAENDPQVGINTTDHIPKWDGSALVSSSIFENSTGNVGIGTESPSSGLELFGFENTAKLTYRPSSVVGPLLSFEGGNSTFNQPTSQISRIDFKGTGSAQGRMAYGLDLSDPANDFLDFQVGMPAGANGMRINGNGSVGIGTTSTDHSLEVRRALALDTENDIAMFGANTPEGSRSGLKIALFDTSPGTSMDWTTIHGINTNLRLKPEIGDISLDGNVGIGTDSPGGSLEIVGSAADAKVKFGGSDRDVNHISSERDLVFNSAKSGNEIAFHFQSAPYNNFSNVTDLMTILGNGNVGIGKPNPSAKLHTFSSVGSGTHGITIDAGGNVNGSSELRLHNSVGNTEAYLASYRGDFKIGVGSASNLYYALRIDPTGDIGIGYGALGEPATKLDINGGIQFKTSDGGIFSALRPDSELDYTQNINSAKRGFSIHGGGTENVFEAYANPTGTNYINGLTVSNDGYVGIGTSEPGELLELRKDDADVAIRIHEPGGTEFKIGSASSDNNLRIVNTNGALGVGASTKGIIINPNGDVGIGAHDPNHMLDIGGAIRIRPHGVGEGGQITIDDSEDGEAWVIDQYSGSGEKMLRIFHNNETNGLVIHEDGKVGIGTTNPDAKLDVMGGVLLGSVQGKANFGDYDMDATTSFNILGNLNSDTRLFSVHASPSGTQGNALSGTIFDVFGHNGTSHIPALNIKNSGNVGIGTTSPNHKLVVEGAISSHTYFGDGSNLIGVAKTPTVPAHNKGFNESATIAANDCSLIIIDANLKGKHNGNFGESELIFELRSNGNTLDTPIELRGNKSGGSGHAWHYGGSTSRRFYITNTNITHTITAHIQNTGYTLVEANYTAVCF